MREDVLDIPDHLRDALWKVESARLAPSQSAGLLVCGVGGSAIGGDLAAAVLAGRLARPMITIRGYSLPTWATPEWAVLCSSYSGQTEETVSCFEQATALGARRIIAGTGGRLGELARASDAPVIGLPGIIKPPRAAVAYMFVTAAAAAAACGVGEPIDAEIESAATELDGERDSLQQLSAELAEWIGSAMPVIYGAGLTVPVARRWKGQFNENTELPAFASELPEASHNEIAAWGWAPDPDGSDQPAEIASAGGLRCAILLADADQHPRERRRIELTASMISEAGSAARVIETRGDSRTARLMWGVMLGDLVSLDLAERAGVEPEPILAIDRIKELLG